MLIHIPAAAGKPYRPSNGTEGEIFMEQFCYRCKHDSEWREHAKNPCPILCESLCGQADGWVYDSTGRPMCTAFVEVKE